MAVALHTERGSFGTFAMLMFRSAGITGFGGGHSAGRSRERIAALIFATLIHIVLVLYLVSIRFSAPVAPIRQGALTSVALSKSSAESPSVAEPLPVPSVIREVRSMRPPAASAETESLGEPDAGQGACAPLQLVTDALATDPLALSELESAPRAARSVADAIVMWNDGWDPHATAVDAPLSATRLAVERSLGGLDQNCLDLPVSGPRFVSIVGRRGTTTLVFGSGVWGWGQVLEEGSTEPPIGEIPWFASTVRHS